MLLAAETLSDTAKTIIEGGGWTALVTVFLAGLLALHRGWIRIGREVSDRAEERARETARLEKEIERRDKEVSERTADRDKWISSFLTNMEIIRKQGEAVERLKESIEGLKESVEALARVVERRGPG